MCKVKFVGKKGESHIKTQNWASMQAIPCGRIALSTEEKAEIRNNLSLRRAKPHKDTKAPEIAKPIDFCSLEDAAAMLPVV